MIIMRSLIKNKKGRSVLMRDGRSHFYFRYSLIRKKKGRSLFHFRRSVIRNNKGRSQFVQSSKCLVFGVKGDRSFILGDRSSKIIKGDRYLCVKGDRSPYNHRIRIVEINQIVSEKRRWVSLRQPNLQVRAILPEWDRHS